MLKRSIILDNTIMILVHNVVSLSKHANDILSHRIIMSNYIIWLTETQISLSDSTYTIVKTLNFFNINFNNSEDKFLNLAYRCRNNVVVSDKVDTNGVSIFSFKKNDFADRVFTLMLVYKNYSMPMQNSFQMLQYLLPTNSVDIVAGDFNFDLLKVSENNLLLNHFMEQAQIVNQPTHISGSLKDHVYIKKTSMEEISANATVETVFNRQTVWIRGRGFGREQEKGK